MSKKTKKRAVLAVVMAVTMIMLSVVAYANPFVTTCGSHGLSAEGGISKTNTTASAYISTVNHTNSATSISVTMTVVWVSSNGVKQTTTVSGGGSQIYKEANFTLPSPGAISSVSSSHNACGRTFSLSA